jgi:hypothetical protein
MRTMIKHTKQPWWLTLTGSIIGFDGEEGGEGGSGEGAGDGGENTEEGAGKGEGAAGKGDEGKGSEPDNTGLKSALQKERDERKKLEKELKTFRTEQQKRDDSEKTEVERLKGENDRVAQKATKLAQGFRQNAIETAVLKAAGALKFRDPSDALRSEILSAITVEQDDDDPTKVEIDQAIVDAAIKKLAKDKPHYIATDEKKLPPKSGSTFGGSGGTPKGDPAKEALLKKYPALRGIN